jgi:hypothetical protein
MLRSSREKEEDLVKAKKFHRRPSSKTQPTLVPRMAVHAIIMAAGRLNLMNRVTTTLQECSALFGLKVNTGTSNAFLYATLHSKEPTTAAAMTAFQTMEANNQTANSTSYSLLINIMVREGNTDACIEVIKYIESTCRDAALSDDFSMLQSRTLQNSLIGACVLIAEAGKWDEVLYITSQLHSVHKGVSLISEEADRSENQSKRYNSVLQEMILERLDSQFSSRLASIWDAQDALESIRMQDDADDSTDRISEPSFDSLPDNLESGLMSSRVQEIEESAELISEPLSDSLESVLASGNLDPSEFHKIEVDAVEATPEPLLDSLQEGLVSESLDQSDFDKLDKLAIEADNLESSFKE